MRWLKPSTWSPSASGKKTGKGKKSGRGKKPARGKAQFGWRPGRRTLLALAGLLALGGLAGLGASGWFGQQYDRLIAAGYRLTADAGLAVDDVLVVGRRHTDRGRILDALQLERGAAILDFDPYSAKERLERLPWVREAEVERRLPGLVHVELVEREPIAIWQLHGENTVIDDAGGVIDGAKAGAFAELPMVVGEDAPAHAVELLRVLDSEPDLGQRVEAAVRVGGRRWNLRMTGGIDVQLPEAEMAAAWAQLANIERQHGLLERDVAMIDLRLPDRLIVRATPNVRPRRRPAEIGKDT